MLGSIDTTTLHYLEASHGSQCDNSCNHRMYSTIECIHTFDKCSSPHSDKFFTIFLKVRVLSLSRDCRVSSNFVSPIESRSDNLSGRDCRSDTLSEKRSSSNDPLVFGAFMIVMGFLIFKYKNRKKSDGYYHVKLNDNAIPSSISSSLNYDWSFNYFNANSGPH